MREKEVPHSILITGENSYIGESVKTYLSKFNNGYYVETIDMEDKAWKNSVNIY